MALGEVVIPDLRRLGPAQDAQRYARAQVVRQAYDIPGFPHLAYWNYDPCPAHRASGLEVGCQRCGVLFRRHQRVGTVWLWLAKHGLLADPVGTGKTVQIAGLLAMLKESGELGEHRPHRRAVVVAQAAACQQWQDELRRFVPAIMTTSVTGYTAAQRVTRYLDPWEVLVISPEALRLREIRAAGGTRRAGDLELLEQFDIGLVVYDDVDAMRNYDNKAHYAVMRLCERADRVVGVHGTPLQKRLVELWSFLAPVGGLSVFGPLAVFRQNFVRTDNVTYHTKDRFGYAVQRVQRKDIGVKNGARLRSMVAPLTLRRTEDQIDDVELPVLQPHTVWLEPSPAQRRRYAELKQGVLRKIRQEGEQVSRATAMAQFMHGWQICAGLSNLDEVGAADSVKLDWVVDRLDGDLAHEKVVCFVNFKPNVIDLSQRLTRLGIGHVLMWGNEASPRVRAERLQRFRDDPACRVLIGTTTIERSLNLQSARHLIAVDTIINPARMTQIAGRIRRDGSRHRTVYVHTILLRGTQEAGYPEILRREQAISDYVWGDAPSEMFGALSPLQLLRLISGDPSLAQAAGR